MTDDLSMNALAGRRWGPPARVPRLDAGCDIALHCNGRLSEMAEMTAIAAEVGALSGTASDRSRRGCAGRPARAPSGLTTAAPFCPRFASASGRSQANACM